MGQLTGKLTLLSLNTRGKGGVNMLPAIRFQYDLGSDAITQSDATLTAANGGTPANFTTTNGNFNVGDLIMATPFNVVYGGVIMGKSQSGGTWTYTLTNCTYTGSTTTASVTTTKNPPYSKDGYDIWGMYKSDYNTSVTSANENLGRITSAISARATDAWSLRKISTPIGTAIKLLYESDDYYKSALENGDYSFTASNVTQVSGNANRLRIDVSETGNGLNNYYQVNDPIQLLMVVRSVDPNAVVGAFCSWIDLKFTNEMWDSKNSANTTIIREVGANYLIVENPDFANWWISPIPVVYADGSRITTTCIKNKIPNACNIKVPERLGLPGGGIRVKKITIEDNSLNSSSSIVYNYNSLVNPQSSSGVTAYEPWVLEKTIILHPNPSDVDGPKMYKRAVYKDIHTLLSIAREVPPPGVMYEYVSVTNEVKHGDEVAARSIEGKTQYQFEVFRQNMIGREAVSSQQGSNSLGTYYVKNIAMKKFTGSIGNVKRVIQYDKDGKKISETIHQYLHDGLENLPFADFMTQYKSRIMQYNYQGYIQERYAEVKEVSHQDNAADNGVKATLSAREEYPCILIGQSTINNLDGTRTASENVAFDFYSGAVTKKVATDAWGNRFMTEEIPAYRKYPSMGLKLNDGNNKNMLSQITGSYGYKVDDNNTKLGLVKSEVTVWSNGVPVIDKDGNAYTQNNYSNGNVWRPQSTWLWMPDGKTTDGLTATGNFVDFNWTTPTSSDPGWKKSEELTLYDVYSKALEAKDMYNNYVSTRMGYNNTKVVLSGSPANYYEIAYSGAEDEGVNQSSNLFVKRGAGSAPPNTGIFHTGKQSLLLPPHGNKGFVYTVNTNNLTPGRNYTAGVWVRPGSLGTPSNVQLYYSINGTVQASSISSGSSTKIAGDWALINLTIPGSAITAGNTLEVGCINNDLNIPAWLDDFRFQPLDAQTTAYVYDPFSGELTHILNNNNLYTKYEYDAAGRLVKTYREKLNVGALKVAEQQYNMGACVHKSYEQWQVFTKNNCGSGYTGTMVRYKVPAGTYCSDISPSDATNQAMRDIAANGQQNANNRGACVIGGIIQVNVANLPVSVPAMVVAFVGSNYYGNWPCFNGTTYANLEPGTYNIQVQQTDNISRTVTISGYGSQTGANLTFNNVVIGTTQLTITIN
jgi:YD repeat-containing protein